MGLDQKAHQGALCAHDPVTRSLVGTNHCLPDTPPKDLKCFETIIYPSQFGLC